MELIYATEAMDEVGILDVRSADFAFGASENKFDIEVLNNDILPIGYFVYAYNGECGGRITGLDDSSSDGTVKLKGRTWHGIIAQKVIQPNSGSSHLTVTGEANQIIAGLLTRLGLNDIFAASTKDSGIDISGYTFQKSSSTQDSGRYVNAYTGIMAMLMANNAKMRIRFDASQKKAVISAMATYDWSKDEEWDSDLCDVNVEIDDFTNHLICLGGGEGVSRTVIHRYSAMASDATCIISSSQMMTGMDEIMDIYDYSNAKDSAELIRGGDKRLQEAFDDSITVSVDLSADDDKYDINDLVGGTDLITGITASARINKKTITIKSSGKETVEYETGAFCDD